MSLAIIMSSTLGAQTHEICERKQFVDDDKLCQNISFSFLGWIMNLVCIISYHPRTERRRNCGNIFTASDDYLHFELEHDKLPGRGKIIPFAITEPDDDEYFFYSRIYFVVVTRTLNCVSCFVAFHAKRNFSIRIALLCCCWKLSLHTMATLTKSLEI